MDNTILHDLLVSINDYVINEKTRPLIEDISERIEYYSTIVSEYYYLNNTLVLLRDTLQDSELLSIVLMNIDELQVCFDSYKNEILITEALQILDSDDERILFFDKLIKFEKSIISNPVIKVDETTIQDIINTATIFSKKVPKIFYFQNNPFMVDEVYKVVIPVKKEYLETEIFLSELLCLYKHYSLKEIIN